MDCCTVNDLDREFNQAWARKELKSYRRKGLAKRARKLGDLLKQQDLSGATLLEVGCGISAPPPGAIGQWRDQCCRC